MEKEITITVNENVVHELADILCWLSGYAEAKDEYWKSSWLLDSAQGVRELKKEIEGKLK